MSFTTTTANLISPKTLFSREAKHEIFYPESDGKPMAETDIHRDLLMELVEGLKLFFKTAEEVYVTGNIMFYYTEGLPEDCISPDVMVVFGVPKGERRSYFLWQEKQPPAIVIELASTSSWKSDRIEKPVLYAMLGVREYFVFNPLYPSRSAALLGFRLNKSGYYDSLELGENRLFSEQLGLELVDTGETLRLFNPESKKFLPTIFENAEKAEKADELELENAQLKARLAELEALVKK